MVDGVLASCYPSANHDLAHLAMKPIQLFPKITQWILGLDSGFQVYTCIVEKLSKWIVPCGQLWDY